jgi:hypothetical protein
MLQDPSAISLARIKSITSRPTSDAKMKPIALFGNDRRIGAKRNGVTVGDKPGCRSDYTGEMGNNS